MSLALQVSLHNTRYLVVGDSRSAEVYHHLFNRSLIRRDCQDCVGERTT